MDNADETIDPPYLVPSHLREPQSIGPIPVRTFFVLLGSGLLLGAPAVTAGREAFGDVGLWLGLLPIALCLPFAWPWLDPPAEHGFVNLGSHVARVVWRNITWTRLPPRQELAWV